MATYNQTAYNQAGHAQIIKLKAYCNSDFTWEYKINEVLYLGYMLNYVHVEIPYEGLPVSSGVPLAKTCESEFNKDSTVITRINEICHISNENGYKNEFGIAEDDVSSGTTTPRSILASVNYLQASSSSNKNEFSGGGDSITVLDGTTQASVGYISSVNYMVSDSESHVEGSEEYGYDADGNLVDYSDDTKRVLIAAKYYMSEDEESKFDGSTEFEDPVAITQIIITGVNIPVNGHLVIDSDGYTVTLDGDNVLHLHSGVWLDELNRDVVYVGVDNIGKRKVTLDYAERYL